MVLGGQFDLMYRCSLQVLEVYAGLHADIDEPSMEIDVPNLSAPSQQSMSSGMTASPRRNHSNGLMPAYGLSHRYNDQVCSLSHLNARIPPCQTHNP